MKMIGHLLERRKTYVLRPFVLQQFKKNNLRQAEVLYKKEPAGLLIQIDDGSFVFTYYERWFNDATKPAISLTLPKTQQEFQSKHLFPFFYNMLPEGSNKQTVCFENRIDTNDHFGILLTTARYDTIGAVQIRKIEN